jgi:uncharacterized protein YabN with tetrapyrrole methylase and pyrophosphatase domain
VLEGADEVLYVAADPVAATWLQTLNPRSRSLHTLYEQGVNRDRIYSAIAEEILKPAREGRRVCAAFYGHPGFLARPAHEALARAREEGIDARMLPAVSALDCLFADLGLDPADTGLQTYDATDFLLRGRAPDTSAALVLWQLSVIGRTQWSRTPDYAGIRVLVEQLRRWYPSEHSVTVYEASPYPAVAAPRIDEVPLGTLAEEHITPMSTLYVPPASARAVDAELAERLRLDPQDE